MIKNSYRQSVDELREQFSEEIGVLNKKIGMLLPKSKKKRQVELLSDPVDNNLLPNFLTRNSCQRKVGVLKK